MTSPNPELVAPNLAAALKKVLPSWFEVDGKSLDAGEWTDLAKELVAEMGTDEGLPPGVAPPMRDRPFLNERQFMETARMQYQLLYRLFKGEYLDDRGLLPLRYEMVTSRYEQPMHFDIHKNFVMKEV